MLFDDMTEKPLGALGVLFQGVSAFNHLTPVIGGSIQAFSGA